MSSTPGLPTPGASLALRVSFVDVHSEVIPVQLWGLVGERRDEYLRLNQEIQEAAATRGPWALGGASALPGELCLVQVGPRWHRGRVSSRQGQDSRVFLLDEGRTITAGAGSLVPGRSEFFHLPSEVLGCVLAGLVPAGGGGKPQHWPASALDFLSHLQGKELCGRVLDVLLPHRLVFLEVPALFQQMQELGLARQVPHNLFRSLLKRYLPAASSGLGSWAPASQRVPPKRDQPSLDYFYPQLQLGVTEPVLVTQVCHPHRIHCQLRSFSQEIRRLSESMAHIYQGSTGPGGEGHSSAAWGEREESPDKSGSPCASCGLDGRWYRALLLETFRPQRCAQVLHIDSGRKELVSCSSLRYLLPEYFRMPVVTYPCALHGLCDGGRGWSRSQVGGLKALILGQAVNAKIEFYCSFEHVYYVTLYAEDGVNLNCVFGGQSCCLTDRFLQSQGPEEDEEEEEEEEGEEPEVALHCQSPEEVPEELALPALRSVRLKTNAFYDAQVEFVKDPSEFWIGLRKHRGTLGKLMRRMCSFYSSARKLDGVVLRPRADDLCCVRWTENGYYRALVTRLDDKSVDVFLVDRGNSEKVDWGDVRMLLPQFRRLPGLALRCALADIWPLAETWSQEAISFFKKTVLHKELVIHVLDSKQDNRYVVEILDESRPGEENIGKVIAQAGYAKYQEFETRENGPGCAQSLGHVSNCFGGEENKMSSAKKEEGEQKTKGGNKTACAAEAVTDTEVATNVSAGLVVQEKERRVPVYAPLIQNFLDTEPGSCKGEITVGSTIEVKVSNVKNPGYFWCQLTRNMQGFKVLMCDIQDYCRNSPAPYQGTTPACLAKRTANGKWSRALIRETHVSSELVKVVFVDYGDKDTVSVKNICSITEEFLQVKAQAFRCSLYNLIQPTSQNPFAWGEKAIRVFREFVVNAWKDNLELKCTIFAAASTGDEKLFYIVDLLTPSQSASQMLAGKGLARPIKLPTSLAFPVQLRSYYYSTYDIKIRSEEPVRITHVDDPWTFYCQLGRNAHILEQLSCSIIQLNKTSLNVAKSPLTPGALCLAKYTDRNWYRGMMVGKDPNKVFFVDFGNTYVMADADLLSIPSDACDVLFLPMQAIRCALSDIPDHIPEEVTAWLQETISDKSLKAMIVAKDPDGRLMIELYDDSIQINASINEKLALLGYDGGKRKIEDSEVLSTTETLGVRKENMKSSPTEHLSKPGESKTHSTETLAESCKPQASSACRELRLPASSSKTGIDTQQRDSEGNKKSDVSSLTTEKEEGSFAEPPLLKVTKPEATPLEGKTGGFRNRDAPLKFSEFPQKTVMPGFRTTVYVSHVNDLSDFYVQLTEDEAELNRLSERLNDVRTRPECYAGPPLQRGDIICATFPDDNLWYRAVVREQQPSDLLSVQFIDYGNVSVIPADKIGQLTLVHALLPRLCIHCSLRGLWVPEILSCKEMMRYFSRRTDEAQIRCEFVKFQDRWEVILADEHGIIAEDMISRYTFSEKSEIGLSTHIMNGDTFPKSADKTNIDTSVFLNWYNPKMKMMRVYATVIDGPEYFWCQFADTEKLQYLEGKVQTAGEQATDWRSHISCPHIGDPCIVRYREDGHFYRALITSICDDSLVSVRLVDFGNMEDCVDPKALWTIPPELLGVPMQAFPCCLSGFHTSEGACPQEGNDLFYEIVTEDVLEITIVDIKEDICDIPLAVVDLISKGESINEKMRTFSKTGVRNSDLPCEQHGPEMKGALGCPDPDVGLQKPSSEAGQEKTPYVEPRADELSERTEKDLTMMETKPDEFHDPETDDIFEALENLCKGKIGSEAPEGEVECPSVNRAKLDGKHLTARLNTLLLGAGETKEILELSSLEVTLSPDDESKEFVELESMELQHSLVGDEGKEEPDLVPPVGPLPLGYDTQATLDLFTTQLPLTCEAEKQPELELPTAQLCLESVGVEDSAEPSCVQCFDDQRGLSSHLHGKDCEPKEQMEMNIYKEEFTERKNRDAISSLTSSFPEEGSRDEKKHGALPDCASAQPEDTYTLKGFTVGSKCVVWSRHTWSKCEILEIAEEGTRVLNLSNGVEEIVNPENVWNGIPKLDKSPPEKRGLEVIQI